MASSTSFPHGNGCSKISNKPDALRLVCFIEKGHLPLPNREPHIADKEHRSLPFDEAIGEEAYAAFRAIDPDAISDDELFE